MKSLTDKGREEIQMARQRLIHCEFINSASFKVNVSNRAKLLYLLMVLNGDDRGFVDTTQDLINALEKNDQDFDKVERLELLENTYQDALQELIDKGYLYEFRDNHSNKVHLVRHWFYHNKWKNNLYTNYRNFLDQVHLENSEYILGKKPLKEDKIKETKTNEININQIEEIMKTETKPKSKPNSDELSEDDFPFVVDLKQLKENSNG